MDIRIKATDYQLTHEVSAYLDARIDTIEKSLAEHADHARCEVEIGRIAGHPKRGEIWFAEFNVVAGGKRIRATAESESVNEAVEQAKDEIIRQIRKHQQLHRRLLRKGGSIVKSMLRFGREA